MDLEEARAGVQRLEARAAPRRVVAVVAAVVQVEAAAVALLEPRSVQI